MSARLSTHVLDTARGVPGAGIALALYALEGEARTLLAERVTNADGRTDAPLADALAPGHYEIAFHVGTYLRHGGASEPFFETIPIRFRIGQGVAAYHVPLLLSPFGYTTYRGS